MPLDANGLDRALMFQTYAGIHACGRYLRGAMFRAQSSAALAEILMWWGGFDDAERSMANTLDHNPRYMPALQQVGLGGVRDGLRFARNFAVHQALAADQLGHFYGEYNLSTDEGRMALAARTAELQAEDDNAEFPHDMMRTEIIWVDETKVADNGRTSQIRERANYKENLQGKPVRDTVMQLQIVFHLAGNSNLPKHLADHLATLTPPTT